MTIVEFLRARYDEDEAAARAAAAGGAWRYEDGDSVGAWTLYDEHWTIASLRTYRHEAYEYANRMPAFRHPAYVDADANGRHIARHDPARVLREVEAHRRILAMHWPHKSFRGDVVTCGFCAGDGAAEDWPCPHVRLLAMPYDSHPDYDPSWSPA